MTLTPGELSFPSFTVGTKTGVPATARMGMSEWSGSNTDPSQHARVSEMKYHKALSQNTCVCSSFTEP